MARKDVPNAGPPWLHQRMLRDFLYNFTYVVNAHKFEALPFARFDDGDLLCDSADIVIVDVERGLAPIYLEIMTKRELADYTKKARARFDDYPFLQEAFFVDYETEQWWKLTPADFRDVPDDVDLELGDFSRELEDLDPENLEAFLEADEQEDHLPSYSSVLRVNMEDFVVLDL